MSFLYNNEPAERISIPEIKSEEEQMVMQMTRDFVSSIKNDRAHELSEQPILMREAGELGLVGAHIPEVYGGIGLNTFCNTLIGVELGLAGSSFDTTFAAHIGIGMLPIYFFGSHEQKQKYLPALSSGEKIMAYCLTEPGAGSDALGAKTVAIPTDDGNSYLISGQKMWISNAGFADYFIVFAKINGSQFTSFIVDSNSNGLTLGAEEHKLGLKGSSTRQVFFENVVVPKENILGEIGKGHIIAFSVLNIGRFKLGVITSGGARNSINHGIQYAVERIQFGQPISEYGAIREKIAKAVANSFSFQSVIYRLAGWLDHYKNLLNQKGIEESQKDYLGAKEFAACFAMVKIKGSEMLSEILDEVLQIHGGMGYSEEGTVARDYRDGRINRIYEGTNEINRLLIPRLILKGAEKGENMFVNHLLTMDDQWPEQEEFKYTDIQNTSPIAALKKLFQLTSKTILMAQLSGQIDLRKNQHILLRYSDLSIEILGIESCWLRSIRLLGMEGSSDRKKCIESINEWYYEECLNKLRKAACEILQSLGNTELAYNLGVAMIGASKNNSIELLKDIAKHSFEVGEYPFTE